MPTVVSMAEMSQAAANLIEHLHPYRGFALIGKGFMLFLRCPRMAHQLGLNGDTFLKFIKSLSRCGTSMGRNRP